MGSACVCDTNALRDFTLRDYSGNFACYCVKAAEMLNNRSFAEFPENRAVKP